MRILDKYIAKNVLSAVGLVSLMLAGMQIFILLISQLGELGKGQYGILQAGLVVLLQMPYQVYLFFPMASLLGCLIGLSLMANHSELIVMRAAGFSIGQITWAVLKAALLVVALVSILGETLIPLLSHKANDYKTFALSNGQTLRTARGLWLRHDTDFISIGSIRSPHVIESIFQFHFNAQHELLFAREIKEAHYQQGGWIANQIKQTSFFADHTEVKITASQPWEIQIKPDLLDISGADPDEMTLYALYRYMQEQKQSQQNANSATYDFLQRLIQPLTSTVMMLLAIPFIFGPLRSKTMGSKLLLGATVGFGFHIINHFFGPLSTVFQFPPELAAIGPTLIFALIGICLMRRVR